MNPRQHQGNWGSLSGRVGCGSQPSECQQNPAGSYPILKGPDQSLINNTRWAGSLKGQLWTGGGGGWSLGLMFSELAKPGIMKASATTVGCYPFSNKLRGDHVVLSVLLFIATLGGRVDRQIGTCRIPLASWELWSAHTPPRFGGRRCQSTQAPRIMVSDGKLQNHLHPSSKGETNKPELKQINCSLSKVHLLHMTNSKCFLKYF